MRTATRRTEHVGGINKGKIFMYALSTCIWCKKTKRLLDELGVEYDYIFVDLLGLDEQNEIETEVARWNPEVTYPTIVVDDTSSINGYKPDELKKRFSK